MLGEQHHHVGKTKLLAGELVDGRLKPETLAVMHGSSYIGKSDKLLTDLAGVIKESFNNGQ